MASGKINGVVTGTSKDKYDFWVEWSSKAYPSGGYSLVSATAYLKRNDGYTESAFNLNVAAADKYIKVDGIKKTSAIKGIDTRNSAKVVISSAKDIKVIHEDDGYATITIASAFPYVTDNLSGGNLSKKVTLDKIDNAGVKLDVTISDITQTGAKAVLSADDVIDAWSYSLNNGETWRDWGESNSKEVTLNHTIFKPNTVYNIRYKVRRKSNKVVTISKTYTIKTLPIYITEIQAEDMEINIGDTADIIYKIYPENASIKKINVIPNDKDIVLTNGNKITALKKGTTYLTLHSTDGSNVSKIINVDVVQNVKGININQNEIIVPKNHYVGLEYEVLPIDANNKSVIITSSDESIAKVVGNDILGLEIGNAVVTITTIDGNYKSDVLVTVSGDYVWYDYSEPIKVLNSSDVMQIKTNIETIRSLLLQNGYPVESLKQITATPDVEMYNIFDILQNIEYNLDIINDNNAKSIYYIEPKVVGDYALDINDIWRWIQILNEMYDILTGVFPKWQYLLCTDGFPTIDNKKILIRGDLIG